MYYVYILKGEKSHYVGYTGNIDKRVREHKNGEVATTSKMGKIVLLGYFTKESKADAIKLENMIKRNGHVDHRLHHSTFVAVQ